MKHITVVYSIHDMDSFAPELERIKSQFGEPNGKPWAVTAMSMDNEIRRMELLEEAAEEEDLDLINAIFSHIDIGNIKALSEL